MRGCRCTGLRLCDQCTALAQRAGVLAPAEAPAVSEAAWQAAVIRLARDAGYLHYHVHDARRSPHGWPDLALAHPTPGHPLYLVELKTATGQCTRAQDVWLAALAGSTGVVTGVWRPAMIDQVREALRR